MSYLDTAGDLQLYRSRVDAIGASQAADLACELLEIERPGSAVIQRAAKLVKRTSVLRRQGQPDPLRRAVAC